MRDKEEEEDQVPGTNQPPEEEKTGVDRRRFIGAAGAVAVGALARPVRRGSGVDGGVT